MYICLHFVYTLSTLWLHINFVYNFDGFWTGIGLIGSEAGSISSNGIKKGTVSAASYPITAILITISCSARRIPNSGNKCSRLCWNSGRAVDWTQWTAGCRLWGCRWRSKNNRWWSRWKRKIWSTTLQHVDTGTRWTYVDLASTITLCLHFDYTLTTLWLQLWLQLWLFVDHVQTATYHNWKCAHPNRTVSYTEMRNLSSLLNHKFNPKQLLTELSADGYHVTGMPKWSHWRVFILMFLFHSDSNYKLTTLRLHFDYIVRV